MSTRKTNPRIQAPARLVAAALALAAAAVPVHARAALKVVTTCKAARACAGRASEARVVSRSASRTGAPTVGILVRVLISPS